MRLLNIFAALSGLIVLIMLVLAAHALQPAPEDLQQQTQCLIGLEIFAARTNIAPA